MAQWSQHERKTFALGAVQNFDPPNELNIWEKIRKYQSFDLFRVTSPKIWTSAALLRLARHLAT